MAVPYLRQIQDSEPLANWFSLIMTSILLGIEGGVVKELDNEEYAIPKEKIVLTQKVLFDFVANQVASFIKDRKITKKLPMGFTFSFPVHNTSLTSGTLVRWTKCFDADGAVGEDPVQLLREAFKRKGVCHLLILVPNIAVFIATDSSIEREPVFDVRLLCSTSLSKDIRINNDLAP